MEERKRGRIEIDWQEVFHNPPSPDSGNRVQFESPSSAPHTGLAAAAKRSRAGRAARASSSDDDGKRRRTPSPNRRFQGLRSDLGRRMGGRSRGALVEDSGGARRPVTRASTKAARQGLDGRSAARDAFSFKEEDADVEDVGRKYCVKSSPNLDRKNKYGQLPLIRRQRQKTISVDQMYKRQQCSTPVSGNLQRVHAIDPDESDNGKCQQSENSSFGGFTKRTKEQLQASSSVYSRKVQDVVLLDDEDMQTEGEVNYEMSGRRNEPKIYYPSRDDPEAVELTGSDINCLDPGAFLSSPVINYYIQIIKRNILCSDDCREKFYIFNTYFYGKLEEALYRRGDFSKLRRWWKGVNIFHRAYIILPIHGTAHWSLVIICMPAKESISGPIILHLDSLGMHRSTKILDTVERYLEEEWRYLKKNPSPDTSVLETTWEDLSSNIHKEKVQVPQQNNAYDCGIFMLYYIRRFIREAPERFTIDKLDMFSCSWFNPEDASDLRQRIRALLLKEFESAGLDNAMSDGATSNGSSIEDSIKGGESEGEAPSDSSEMAVDFGNTGKSNEGIKVAASEEECGVSADAGKSNKGIKVAESEEASREYGDAGMTIEGIDVADSEEATGESGDAGKRIEGYVAESEEERGGLGDAWKSTEGTNVAEPVEASVEFGDAGKSIEFINVAESDEESVELGHAGKTKKGFKVAASEEGSVECVSTDKSMESVSDEEHTSSIRRGERTAGCALWESDSAIDDDGTMKADFDSSKTEKEGLIAIVSPERPRFNEGAIHSPRTPIPDVVPDSESDEETKMEVVRVYRRKCELKFSKKCELINLE